MNIKDFLLGYEEGKAQGGGGESGGGGSLPAGVYLSNYPTSKSIPQRHRRFFLNGELYAAGPNATSPGFLNIIYKWDGSAWVAVLSGSTTSGGINGTKVDGTDHLSFEFNGKIHFFSQTGQHCAFDGTTLTVYNALPGVPDYLQYATVYKNKIVAYITPTGSLYEWDETTDTWTAIAKLESKTYIQHLLYVINNELYSISSGASYRYENGAMVKINTNIITRYVAFTKGIVHDGAIYGVYRQNAYAYLCRYNPQTDEIIEWLFPNFAMEYWTIDGKDLSFTTQTVTSGAYNPCFVLHIVEDAPA